LLDVNLAAASFCMGQGHFFADQSKIRFFAADATHFRASGVSLKRVRHSDKLEQLNCVILRDSRKATMSAPFMGYVAAVDIRSIP
jgi:hypothetical protein